MSAFRLVAAMESVAMFLTVLVSFLFALALSLLTTPVVGDVARRLGWVDLPSGRKVHQQPVPRVGGISIFVGVTTACAASILYYTWKGDSILPPRQVAGLFGVGALVFGLGLVDDISGLRPRLKLAVQIGAGLIAWASGIGIHALEVPGHSTVQLGIFSLPATLFWFVLVINAINLIDGLDGLAAGVTVFSSIVLLVLGLLHQGGFVCIGLASLAGATLGFLRYNFNPARVFMGDCGSYFIGFMLAALSIVGSIKTQASVTILIPIIALGLPLMEAIWSGLRRFLLGQELFRADNNHLHHRLLKLGYTHRRAVLVLYGFTLALGVLALTLVQASDRLAAFILVGLGLSLMIIIRRLGYVDYITREKLVGWVRDFSDVLGVEAGGRSFLGIQVGLLESASVDDVWASLQSAGRQFKMDYVSLSLDGVFGDVCYEADLNDVTPAARGCADAFDPCTSLRISMPVGDAGHRLGCLTMAQRLEGAPPEYYVLRRMEQLRRTTSRALLRIQQERQAAPSTRKILLTPRVHRPVERPSPARTPQPNRGSARVL